MNKKLARAIKMVQEAGIKVAFKETKLSRKNIAAINEALNAGERLTLTSKNGKVRIWTVEAFKARVETMAKVRANRWKDKQVKK